MLMRLRRRFAPRREEPSVDFDMADLHRLRDTGQLSEAEFERVRTGVLARHAARAAQTKPAPRRAAGVRRLAVAR
jgi:hypothetical protein